MGINQYSSTEIQYPTFDDKIDSIFKFDKNYDFEFRLYTTQESLVYGQQLFILSKYGNRLSARYFKMVPTIEGISEIPIANQGIDTLLSNLIENQLLTLPTQDSIKHKMIRYTGDFKNFRTEPLKGIYIGDGDSYRFEIRSKNYFKSYTYSNPKDCLASFPQTEEFYRICAIIYLVENFIGLK